MPAWEENDGRNISDKLKDFPQPPTYSRESEPDELSADFARILPPICLREGSFIKRSLSEFHDLFITQFEARKKLMTLQIPSMVLVILMASASGGKQTFGPWTPPQNLGCGTSTPAGVNSAFDDLAPAVSKDGSSLYFGSTRPTAPDDVVLDANLWVSQWNAESENWGPPAFLGTTLNSPGADNVPALSRDGHWLFFNSDRPGGQGGVDIWVSWREKVHDDFGWEAPVNLGPLVNTPIFDGGASYFENDDGGAPQLFFTSGPTQLSTDIYVSELQNGAWGSPTRIDELSTPQFFDARPSVRFDGLELFMFSNRSGQSDLWSSTRESTDDPWSEPTNLGAVVNSSSNEQQPYILADRRTLMFVSNRTGGCGGFDIYATTR